MSKESDTLREKRLGMLDDFASTFVQLKSHFQNLKLKNEENVRLAIEYFDNGFLRAREAIFAEPMGLDETNTSTNPNIDKAKDHGQSTAIN